MVSWSPHTSWTVYGLGPGSGPTHSHSSGHQKLPETQGLVTQLTLTPTPRYARKSSESGESPRLRAGFRTSHSPSAHGP